MLTLPYQRRSAPAASFSVLLLSAAMLVPVAEARADKDDAAYQTIEQEIVFEVDGPAVKLEAGFARFDDQGGTRLLREVTIETKRQYWTKVSVENESAAPVDAPSYAFVTGYDREFLGSSGSYGRNSSTSMDGTLAPADGQPRMGPDFHQFPARKDAGIRQLRRKKTTDYLVRNLWKPKGLSH